MSAGYKFLEPFFFDLATKAALARRDNGAPAAVECGQCHPPAALPLRIMSFFLCVFVGLSGSRPLEIDFHRPFFFVCVLGACYCCCSHRRRFPVFVRRSSSEGPKAELGSAGTKARNWPKFFRRSTWRVIGDSLEKFKTSGSFIGGKKKKLNFIDLYCAASTRRRHQVRCCLEHEKKK